MEAVLKEKSLIIIIREAVVKAQIGSIAILIEDNFCFYGG